MVKSMTVKTLDTTNPQTGYHSPLPQSDSFVKKVFLLCEHCVILAIFRKKWQGTLRILPQNEAEVHLRDVSTTEIDIHVQDLAQSREVEAEVEREVEAESATST